MIVSSPLHVVSHVPVNTGAGLDHVYCFGMNCNVFPDGHGLASLPSVG